MYFTSTIPPQTEDHAAIPTMDRIRGEILLGAHPEITNLGDSETISAIAIRLIVIVIVIVIEITIATLPIEIASRTIVVGAIAPMREMIAPQIMVEITHNHQVINLNLISIHLICLQLVTCLETSEWLRSL